MIEYETMVQLFNDLSYFSINLFKNQIKFVAHKKNKVLNQIKLFSQEGHVIYLGIKREINEMTKRER